MKRQWLFCVLLACKSSEPAPEKTKPHHEDRAEPATAPALLAIDVTVDGAAAKWDKAAFARVPVMTGTNNGGESRELWSLRELAHTLVGPAARVVSVTGRGETKAIEQTEWDDAGKTPVLQTTRRGTFKFRWIDTAGKWLEAEIKDANQLAIVTR